MTQLFDEAGNAHPVTVVQAGPVVVTQVKTEGTDGYSAVQVGLGEKKDTKASKPEMGKLTKLREKNADAKAPKTLREFVMSADEASKLNAGDTINLTTFTEGDIVTVVGTSKSKGFAGVVKRHNFKGQPRSHGQKHSEHAPGSLGMAGVQRVFKNKRMAGRTGGERITEINHKVMKLDAATNTMYIYGAVPGRRGTLLMISNG